jgi:beta-glucosidase
MASLGIRHYRLSISWGRVLPDGGAGSAVSGDGIDFYNSLFEAMEAEGIEPVVTMHHWDMPQVVNEGGGGVLGAPRLERQALFSGPAPL